MFTPAPAYLASSFSVSGAHGVLVLIAAILFAAAAVIAWVQPAHKGVLTAVALGLCLWALAALWS